MTITSNRVIGQRDYQEDRYVVRNTTNGGLFLAVFDGHGGEACSDKLQQLALEATGIWENAEQYSIDIFKYWDQETHDLKAGSTATLVLVEPDRSKATIATLGDSPAVIGFQTGVYISPEHNVRASLPEADAVRARGGYTYHGYVFNLPVNMDRAQGLQLTRSFGDSEFGAIVSKTPQIHAVALNDDSIIVLGTDGIFDPGHKANSIVQGRDLINKLRKSEGMTATDIILERPDKFDNATAILVRL